jgi:hypothetical protein
MHAHSVFQPDIPTDSQTEPPTFASSAVDRSLSSVHSHSASESQQSRVVHLAALAPRSSGPSFRPSIPREIIVTPSSPRKPDARRTGAFNPGHTVDTRTQDDLSPGSSPPSRLNDNVANGPRRAPVSQNTFLAHPHATNDRGLGLGRPLAFDQDRLDASHRSGLLTPNPILTHRSSSLPAQDRRDANPQTGFPQYRNISFTTSGITQDLSTSDDNLPATPKDRSLGVKTIRKTRSLSDMISRNRKAVTEPDRPSQRPLFTWNASKNNELALPHEEAPQVIMPKRKGNTLLKTAADLLQFRKPRRTSSTDASKNCVSTTSPADSEQQEMWAIEMADSADSGAVSPRVLAVGAGETESPSLLCASSDAVVETPSALEHPPDTMEIAANTLPVRVEGSRQEECRDKMGIAHDLPNKDSGDLEDDTSNFPPPTAFEPSFRADGSASSPQYRKPSPASRSKSGIATPVSWVFKRPQLAPRAQSASSTTSGSSSPAVATDYPVPHSHRSWKDDDSISRSNTIRATKGSSLISSAASRSEQPSRPQSRQHSIDGLDFEPSQPISILRADLSRPPLPLGSPSVSFGGETPRISISSTSSRGDSAINQTRSRRYTSTSQENIVNSLPIHGLKSSRPRSSTLFSTAPVWLAPIAGTGSDKKRASLMRRLSGGLIGNSEDNDRRQTPRSSPQDRTPAELESLDDTVQGNTSSPSVKMPSREPEEPMSQWLARISEVVDRSKMAAYLSSK